MVIGLNQQTASLAVRGRFRINEAKRQATLPELICAEGIEEVMAISTFNRTEFLLWASDASLAANSVFRLLSCQYGLKLCEWEHFYRLLDDDAVVHIFNMVAGLESRSQGEPEIVAQVESAWQQAKDARSAGRFLGAVIQKALCVAERVRSQTKVEWHDEPDLKTAQLTGSREQTGGIEPSDLLQVARGHLTAGAREIVAAEAHGFFTHLLAHAVVPTIVALRMRLDEICRQELDSFRAECGPFSKDEDKMLQAVTSRITHRIASLLARELREFPEQVEQEHMTAAVQRLFHLQNAMNGACRHQNPKTEETPAVDR